MNSEQFVCVWKNRLQTVHISLDNSYLKVTLLKCVCFAKQKKYPFMF